MAIRFQLTGQCNFGCFFCHNEGIDRAPEGATRNSAGFADVLRQAVAAGVTDITLTGGEPLLAREQFLELVAVAGSLNPRPALTVVTNGSIWDGTVTATLAAYGKGCKVHVSIHSFDPALYEKITRRPAANLEKAIRTIRECRAAGIPVKINHVLLRGVNDGATHLEETLRKAADLDATALKVIELLVIPAHWEQHREYRDVQSVQSLLDSQLELCADDGRRRLFRWKPAPALTVELTKCTCKLGCRQCLAHRDMTIGPDLTNHACFLSGARGIPCLGDFPRAIAEGRKEIERMAERFGESSPILNAQEQFFAGRADVFFALPPGGPDPDRILADAGLRRSRIDEYQVYFYRPRRPTPAWRAFRRVLKIGTDAAHPEQVNLIYVDLTTRRCGPWLVQRSRFLDPDGPLKFESLDKARWFLDRLELVEYFRQHLVIMEFEFRGLLFRISRDPPRPNLLITFKAAADDRILKWSEDPDLRDLLARLKARPILKPFPQWLQKAVGGHLPRIR